jgi:hypothetical protein
MYFNRFDICLAYWAFASHWHDGQYCQIYAKFAQLERIKFSPGICQSDTPADLPENAREIYRQLVVKHCGLHSTMENNK